VLGLYLHIPFCQSICSYCNFNRGLFDGALKQKYVDALEREIRGGAPSQAPGPRPQARTHPQADTIFFGGGTPSLLDPGEVARLIAACRETFDVTADAEVTLETNPETATAERFEGFRRAGVTRISFGVQSFDDEELQRLGRIHSAARAKAAVRLARDAGFSSVSFDLMFWLPGQTHDSWRRTIDQAIALAPDHLSLYLLELYPNAPLKEQMARASAKSVSGCESSPRTAQPPRQAQRASREAREARGGAAPRAQIKEDWLQSSDDDAADMYLEALSSLDAAGYEQYEISNVSRPGHVSRHNIKYWQSGSWQGFGCGAHSTVEGVRWKNIPGTAEYIDRIAARRPVSVDEHVLSPEARLQEALFTGLRLSAGVSAEDVRTRFGVDPWQRYGEDLAPLVEAGYVWRNGGRVGLTRPGMLLANEILAIFV
jgi:oxygen-independent coproporphyrinogen-3 oxidase